MGQPARPVSATSRGRDARRTAILAAALDLFGRYGFRRTSIDDIAREAGVAKGTVYLYVESKEALFRSLTQSLLDGVLTEAARAAADTEGPVAARLLAILKAKFSFFHDLLHRSPHASELLDSKGRICADVFRAGDAKYLRLVTKAVADAARSRELAPKRHGLAAADVAVLLFAGAAGIDAADASRTLTNAEHDAQLSALVRVVVAGLVSS